MHFRWKVWTPHYRNEACGETVAFDSSKDASWRPLAILKKCCNYTVVPVVTQTHVQACIVFVWRLIFIECPVSSHKSRVSRRKNRVCMPTVHNGYCSLYRLSDFACNVGKSVELWSRFLRPKTRWKVNLVVLCLITVADCCCWLLTRLSGVAETEVASAPVWTSSALTTCDVILMLMLAQLAATPWPPSTLSPLILGWVTVCWQINHLGM